jgi:hypothetical protein
LTSSRPSRSRTATAVSSHEVSIPRVRNISRTLLSFHSPRGGEEFIPSFP